MFHSMLHYKCETNQLTKGKTMRIQQIRRYNRIQDRIHSIKYDRNGLQRTNITEYEIKELQTLLTKSRALHKELY